MGINAGKAPIATVAINIPTPLTVLQRGVSYDLMYGRAKMSRFIIPKRWRVLGFYGLMTLTAIYLLTAVVYDEGGFGQTLVLKPFHGLLPFYGGGEEGNWQRSHLGEPLPWWLKHEYLTLGYTNLENDKPIALIIYALGYYLTIWGWCRWLVWRLFKVIGAAISRALVIRR